jgi:hypothetical protein
MAASEEPTLQDLTRDLSLTPELIWTIEPEHNSRGGVTLFNPWERYPNRTGLMLHEWGEGPFCRFKIPGRFRDLSGVYLIAISGKIVFSGWCKNLVHRMNQNYGTISPRKCYDGSEPENCLVNHRILKASQGGRKISLYVIPGAGPEISDRIIMRYNLRWNSELAGSEHTE